MSYAGPERRQMGDHDHRLRQIEIQTGILVSRMNSEFGGDGSKGNLNFHFDSLKEDLSELKGVTERMQGLLVAFPTQASVEALRTTMKAHETLDRWLFGAVLTLLIFILGVQLKGG